MVEISVFGSSPPTAYERLTAEVTALLGKVLGLEPSCIYVKYAETSHWGVERRQFLACPPYKTNVPTEKGKQKSRREDRSLSGGIFVFWTI